MKYILELDYQEKNFLGILLGKEIEGNNRILKVMKDTESKNRNRISECIIAKLRECRKENK